MKNIFKGFWPWLILILIAIFLGNFFTTREKVVDLKYSQFKEYLSEGRIIECTIGLEEIEGVFIDEEGKKGNFSTFRVQDDPALIAKLEEMNVDYQGKKEDGGLATFLINALPFIFFILLWVFLIRQMRAGGSQAMSFAQSRARKIEPGKEKVTFRDVAGIEEVKEELQEIIEFLKNPKKFQSLGGKIPKGVLLYGPPGTGKTLLARAVAGEANVPFFSTSGAEFVEMFVGVGASRVRDLFNQGKKNAPSVIFIDELDAVGRHRFAGIGGGHDEREQTLNQLLVEMDGFESNEGVIILAATNRPDVLDPALLRPGRFDRHINVPNPDLKGRKEILEVHTRKVKLADDVDLEIIARRTPGFVGSDLANLVNEAALLAARKGKKATEMVDFEEAIDRVIAGPQRKSRIISNKEKNIVAYHEAGHALVAKLTPGSDPVHKISIIPRGPALGYTLQLPLEDRYIFTEPELIAKIKVLLGGRIAEEVVFGELTTGAEDDILHATEIAYRMVTEYGMSKKLGPLVFNQSEEPIFLGKDLVRKKTFSEKTAQQIDEEVEEMIKKCKEETEKIVRENKEKLDKLALKLIEKEIIEGAEIDEIIYGKPLIKEGEDNAKSSQPGENSSGSEIVS